MSEEILLSTFLKLPVLPLRDVVVFPAMMVPLLIGRPRSVAAIKAAWARNDHDILLITQQTKNEKDPDPKELYSVGTVGIIKQVLEMSDGTVKILVTGQTRAHVTHLEEDENFMVGDAEGFEDLSVDPKKVKALQKIVLKEFENYGRFNSKVDGDLQDLVAGVNNPGALADILISCFSMELEEKQKLLEEPDVSKRLDCILKLLEAENSIYNMEKKIRGRVKKQIEKTQREYYLNEQLRAIHRELGNGDDAGDDLQAFEEKIKKTHLSKEARERATSRLKKLRSMNALSSEANVVRSYLEWLLDIPWNKNTKIKNNLEEAKKILDRDHFGLKPVKDRILEYLAVQARVEKLPGQILCFVGSPGVGKTSLGKSIAEATGRAFVRVSLGGVSDESEIRGHRSTYVGAMPGKIIQGMKKAKSSNPLFLLDEIDKLGHDWRGDPTSALLEVLDPEQNATFSDHYIEVDYDLSGVMFVATANTLDMPQPLLDRMEIIRIPGYTEDEKIAIAERHLIPKQREAHGLKSDECTIQPETIVEIIRSYTREAGVRHLERQIATLARKSVRELLETKTESITIDATYLHKFCGVPKYTFGKSELFSEPGISTGLAWTEVGGDILFIEVLVLDGKGQVIQTGKLGDVMKESIQASISYVRSKSHKWNIPSDFFEKHDIHVHVPEGATPKDGPSAGTAICTALTSALTKIKVRGDVGMTGEINLRGQVMEIGGLKEKLLAAHRAGLKTIIIPQANQKDLEEVDERVREDLTFVMAQTLDDVLHVALTEPEKVGV